MQSVYDQDGRIPWQSITVFEPSGNRVKRRIPTKKPTAGNDDGLVLKKSRGERTPLELFLAGIRSWEARLRRILGCDAEGEFQ